jgi:hypothetical protein
MYVLNQPLRAVFCEDNGRSRIDIIPVGAEVRLAGPSPFDGMVEIAWSGRFCSVFLIDLESRSNALLPVSA